MAEAEGQPLSVCVERGPHCAVVRLSGAAEMAEWGRLRNELEALAREKQAIIVLDLTQLGFIGSEGLAAVVHGHLKGRHHQGQIRLACPGPSVLDVIQRTRLTQLFPIYDSVEAAMKP